MDSEQKESYIKTADDINESCAPPVNLNAPFTTSEILSTVKSAKCGKASASDMISNEILKALNSEHIDFLTDFLNICFVNCVYPWNESIITPILKKGNKSNPDNYRAIAVSSIIGKIFFNYIT